MRKKEIIQDYGKEFITCDPSLDGKPLCRLGVPNGQYTCRTVQVHGAPALQVLDRHRSAVKVGKGYRIFIIGEAPGQYEDRLGIPFVGDAGDLLLQLLEEADLPLSDIFITNTARCRPPKNRNPAAAEINACLTHLYYEFRKHEPDIVILTGRVPLRVFNIRGGGIGNVRGEIFEKQLPLWPDGPTFKVIPTYHPAFLLRKKSSKLNSQVVSDLQIAKALYYGQDPNKKVYQVKYKVCETVQDVKDMVQEILSHGSFAWDSESPNLRLQTSPVITVQFSIGKDKTWIIPFYHHDSTVKDEFQLRPHFNPTERFIISQELSLIFENENIVKLGQNVKYDMNVVKRWLGLETRGTVHDVALLHHLLDCYPPHGLKYLADLEFYVGNYASEVEAIVGTGRELRETYDKVPDEVLWPYGAVDAEMTYRLAELYLPQVQSKSQLWRLYLEESIPSIGPFQEAEWYGTKIDAVNIEFAKNYYSSKLIEAELAAKSLTSPDFNPHSHAQVQTELIKRGLSQQILAPATSAGYSTRKDILIQLDDDLARLVIKCRKYKKRMSTYVERILTDIEHDSRVRYGFNLTSTVSGRQSCRVYHQMPKLSDEKEAGTALRAIFTEEDDFDIVFGDFSQIEVRLFAFLTGEEELIRVLENGEDIHATTAAGALGIDVKLVSKFNRDNVGKPLNFGAIYGSQGHQIANCKFENPTTGQIELVGVDRAKQFLFMFKERFPKVKYFLETVPEEALANGCYVKSVFGRQRYLPDLTSEVQSTREAAEREATNFKIQSAAASINTRTIIAIKSVLKQHNIGSDKVRFIITVHDSILWGVRKNLVSWFKQCFRAVAERPIPEIDGRKFPISIGVGRTWAEAELNSKEN